MTRTLTAARVLVAPADEAAYLATINALARLLQARGQHLWVFRRRDGAGEFLEFTEGRDDGTHRAAGPASPAEAELEARLGTLGAYEVSRWQPWDEVAITSG